MAASRQDIKSRISSVASTRKITKAMQLVASSKLTRQRARMEKNREYAAAMQDLMDQVAVSADPRSIWLHPAKDKPGFVFIITSDMGLCGGYNANVQRMAGVEIDPGDKVCIIGSRGIAWNGSAKNFTDVTTLADVNSDDAYDVLAEQMQRALDLYREGRISRIQVLYTHYKNTLTFVPVLYTILPVTRLAKKKAGGPDTIFEPGKAEMVDLVMPMAAKSLLYSLFLESKTSEQASRRMAMESATDNADELQAQLELEYNRIRQQAITQEITEIVGGANALK